MVETVGDLQQEGMLSAHSRPPINAAPRSAKVTAAIFFVSSGSSSLPARLPMKTAIPATAHSANVAAQNTVIVAAIGIAIAGLYIAFQKNLGGIADFTHRAWARVSLFFEGLKQLIEEGGFSGAVRDELNKAENSGLKNFLINVFLWGNRIMNLLSGVATGFSAGVDAAKPSIDAFLGALQKLGVALWFISERDDAATAGAKFKEFGTTGESVGKVLAQVFDFVVQAMTAVVNVGRGLVEGWNLIRPAAQQLHARPYVLPVAIKDATDDEHDAGDHVGEP